LNEQTNKRTNEQTSLKEYTIPYNL